MSVYQDDVCNFDDDLLQHLDCQQDIYDIMEDNTLVFKSIKGHLNYSTQRILGHIMSKAGRAPDPTLVSTINNLAKPTTLEAVRSCLGLAQVAREYVHNLADIIAPIQQMARKGVDIEKDWGPQQDAAFEHLKTVITTAPVLALPNLMKKFRVHVDACRVGRGIGAILLQVDDNILSAEKRELWQPIAYWSRTLSKEERRYSATELECTGLHDSLIHWRVYLQNGIPFEVIVDHYALVYMVTKMSDAIGNLRLNTLCLGLQGFTFSVIHRKGALHLDADAVSRLFHKDEVAYINTEEDLRDDMNPLTEHEKKMLDTKWGTQDSLQIQEIIARHQMEQRELVSTDIMKGSESRLHPLVDLNHNLDDSMLEANIEYKSDLGEPHDELYQDINMYNHAVNSITSNISKRLMNGILPEYTFCFYCDGNGIITNHYLEGGSDNITKAISPYLLHVNECLICLSIYTWVNGVPTYTSVIEKSGLPFSTPLTADDLREHLHESDKWVQKTINISTLDKVQEILTVYPEISYATYRLLSDLLKINWLSNFVIRLIISTKYKILPQIIIDTLEYDFVMRRMGSRGYTKYFKDLSMHELLCLTSSDSNIMTIIPNFSKLGDEQEYMITILTIMIKEEIKHRQDIEFIKYGTIPSSFYGSISKLSIDHYISDNFEIDDKAQKAHSLSMTSKQWNLSNHYMFNLNDIRTSARLQKKRELKHEKQLEDLRQQQLLFSQRKSLRRTKKYNRKARRNLIRNGAKTAVLQSEDVEKDLQRIMNNFKDQVSTIVSADDSIAINIDTDKATVSLDDSRLHLHIPLSSSSTVEPITINEHHDYANNNPLSPSLAPRTCRRKKRPKMIIVDKFQRRPPSRLVNDEYKCNRDNELIHETLEGYDYLIQEYFMDPTTDQMYMVVNTYLDNDQYKATVCPIDYELQDQKELESPEFKSFNIIGENGIIDLVNKFNIMVTANGSWPISDQQWFEAQQQDEFWLKILAKLDQHNTCIIIKKQDDHLDYFTRELLENGALGPIIRYISVPKQLSHSHLLLSYREEFRQMIIPDNFIISCLEITHRALGHPGFHRMWNTIRKSYFWKSMQHDVRTYCSNCHYCRSRKSSSEKGSIPIQGYYISERPWQRCHIDCMVGLPISDEGQYTAVLILKCALSKFVCLEPLKDVTAQSISEALVNIFTTHGVPEFIISDNGVEFANYLTTDV